MPKYGPSSAFLLVGARDISSDTFVLSDSVESVLEEVRGLGENWEASLPIELARTVIEASGGLYDDEVAGIVEALQEQGESRQLVLLGYSTKALDKPVVMLDGAFAATFKRIISREGLTKAHAIYKVTGAHSEGRMAHSPTAAETGTSGNTDASSLDANDDPLNPSVAITSSSVANPSVITTPVAHGLVTGDVIVIAGHSGSTPSINDTHTVTVTSTTTFTIPVNVTVGGTGGTFKKVTSGSLISDLHVLALTLGGYTSVTFKVRDSADDVTFADLDTFTNVTAAQTAERQTYTGTVRQFISTSYAFNGAGSGQSVTFAIVIAR